jgi:hypothetical protein
MLIFRGGGSTNIYVKYGLLSLILLGACEFVTSFGGD